MNPKARFAGADGARTWSGAQGLADDVRYYGQWMRDEAEKRIGHLYPKVEVTEAMVQERPDLKKYLGRKLTVIAWLWARTVKSPNPAFAHVDVPLISSFMLSTKAGKEAYVKPVIEGDGYRFTVKVGKPDDVAVAKAGTKLARGANFKCLLSDTPMSGDYIKAEGKAGRLDARLMAIVAEGDRERIYLAPSIEHEKSAQEAKPIWRPEGKIATRMTGGNCTPYGLVSWGNLFTPRQLVALTTFSDLVAEACEQVKHDAEAASLPADDKPLCDNGTGARAYAEAVGVYLGFAVDRCADFSNSCTRWVAGNQKVMNLFGKQSIAMTWDYPEAAILHETVGGFNPAVSFIGACLSKLPQAKNYSGTREHVVQIDAQSQCLCTMSVISTDPPYYGNIGYADLSDFFYTWLRRSLRPIFPDLFATMTVPKGEELIASPYRHGSKEKAEKFFLDGMTKAMHQLAAQTHPAYPVTIYYAFKQSESRGTKGATNTGWDTFLASVIKAGLAINGTWPMRSEQEYRMVGIGTNALASCIVLVCRPRPANAPDATRREFLTALKTELPEALRHLQAGNIAPVDLAQAAIGPGMAVYTRFARVLDAEGKPLSVRTALSLINEVLDETLAEQEGDFDADSRWALAWFEQYGFGEGEYGMAETLSKAKNTSVSGLMEAGILLSKSGKVRLLQPVELPSDWDPESDTRLTVWEMVHHLIRVLETDGETAAAAVVDKLGNEAETARELCYRLYTLCERKKRAAEAVAYNALVQSWPEIIRLARNKATPGKLQQTTMFN